MYSRIQELLQDTNNNNEVKDVLNDILCDVETTHALNTNTHNTLTVQALQRENARLKRACDEYIALERERRSLRLQGGIGFLRDLVRASLKFSRMEGELLAHEANTKAVSNLARQLEDSEKRVRTLERRASNSRNANVDTNLPPPPSSLPQGYAEAGPFPPPQTPSLPPPPPHGLSLLDDACLFTVFGFLDPNSVLSAAQVDKSFFKRVDDLFGIGSAVNTDTPTPRVVSQDQVEGKGMSNGSSESKSANPTPSPQRKSVASAAANTLVNAGLSLLGRNQVPTTTQQQTGGEQKVTQVSNKEVNTNSNTQGHGNDLQNQATTNPSQSPSGNQSSALFAASIADKLTAAELKSIIGLTSKLRSAEVELAKTRAEKEDLGVRLEGADNVKEFLTKKLGDVTGNLKRMEEDSRRVDKQRMTDQEVIGFLDGKVREMEKVIEVGEGKRGKAELELKRVKEEKTKQLKVLEDMLQFERQNLATQEASFKQAKKLLVREVKVCRAQLVTMQAERDGMRGERDQLRDALQGGGRRSSLSPGGQ
ncbi:hypothetical protein TrCOL_g3191 [Triparma columacea]|uniref:Uncharacterized protein n=1 Tax=Triparma columacea TaxID=722753 RepID=A0A9W7GB39_9STRA|nr:hypothetical protein TrCOL_g3191 [Triparma columacea]